MTELQDLSADFAQDPALQPFDRHNRELLEQVHPHDWRNPPVQSRYHLVVIGAGTAGLVTAGAAASLGAKVALVEKRLMGGDCLNFGCVPSKALIRSARAWHDAATAKNRFAGPEVTAGGDFAAVMERVRQLRAEIGHHDSAQRFADLGADVFLGEARFVDPRTVEINGQRTRFRGAVIATGASPLQLPIPGLAETPHFTNETIFTLTELPKRLAVIGAGPIGCELAQSLVRFGCAVTVFDIASGALGNEDRDAAEIVEVALQRDGVQFRFNASVTQVATEADGNISLQTQDGAHESADALLVAVGRRPNVAGLGLESAKVEFTNQGIKVNDFLRTSNRRVYAIGDVASRYQFTHVADAEARITVQNALFFGRAKASKLVVPWCTYTSPEVAHVGLTLQEAERDGVDLDSHLLPLKEVDRAILDGATEGFLKIHLRRGSDQILGATLVAEHAGDMIGELALAITHGISIGKISSTIHPYPTQGEVVRKAADNWRRSKLTPFVQRLLSNYFRVLR